MPRSVTLRRSSIAWDIFPAAVSDCAARQSRSLAASILRAPFSIAWATATSTWLRASRESFAIAREATRALRAMEATDGSEVSMGAVEGWRIIFAIARYYRG